TLASVVLPPRKKNDLVSCRTLAVRMLGLLRNLLLQSLMRSRPVELENIPTHNTRQLSLTDKSRSELAIVVTQNEFGMHAIWCGFAYLLCSPLLSGISCCPEMYHAPCGKFDNKKTKWVRNLSTSGNFCLSACQTIQRRSILPTIHIQVCWTTYTNARQSRG